MFIMGYVIQIEVLGLSLLQRKCKVKWWQCFQTCRRNNKCCRFLGGIHDGCQKIDPCKNAW